MATDKSDHGKHCVTTGNQIARLVETGIARVANVYDAQAGGLLDTWGGTTIDRRQVRYQSKDRFDETKRVGESREENIFMSTQACYRLRRSMNVR